ncbi:MAG: thiol-disulfide oxidoreductase DCC family protein [Candidatus Thalassarchaeaceae archaeon]
MIKIYNSDILLMDGDCGLCSNIALFIHPRLGKESSLKFIANKSEEGKNIISTFPKNYQKADTVYLVRNDKTFIRSAAGIRFLLYMKPHYKIFFPIFWLVPLPFRDVIYMLISKYRHYFFKRPNTCIFPDLN